MGHDTAASFGSPSGPGLVTALRALSRRVIAHKDELTDLDRAIGDGDHGGNMARGFTEVLGKLDGLEGKAPADVLKAVGTTLVMKVGGASGPLYGTLFMTLAKDPPEDTSDPAALAAALTTAIDAVKKRGKSEPGQKTLLDVLVPLRDALAEVGLRDPARLRAVADAAAEATVPMRATKGRASFLGERSIGHMDPGARSSALMVEALCDLLDGASEAPVEEKAE